VYLGHYDMDHSTSEQRAAFQKVLVRSTPCAPHRTAAPRRSRER